MRMVREDIATTAAGLAISNIRSIPFPSRIVLVAPAPVMVVTSSVMSRSPVAAASSPRPAIVRR